MLKVALIGPGGQLGTEIVAAKPGEVELVPLAREALDITRPEETKTFLTGLHPDVIINTAAYVRVDDAEDDAEAAFRVNALGVKNLAVAARKTGAVLVHISTDYVFDGSKKPSPYNEDDTPNPLSTYGISKYAGELYAENFTGSHYIVRLAGLYGRAGASGKGGNFVYTILNKAGNGEPMTIVDDIHMSPTNAADAAKEIWRLITEERPFGLYHASNGGVCSWYEFAVKIAAMAGLKADITPVSHTAYKTKARRPLWSPLESVRGIRPREWEDALKDFIGSLSLSQAKTKTETIKTEK